MTLELWKPSFEKHEAAAAAVRPEAYVKQSLSLNVYLQEGHDLVRLARAWWDEGLNGAPGLKVGAKKYDVARLGLLEELLQGLQYATTFSMYQAEPGSTLEQELSRARFIIGELEAGLEFMLDDGVDELADHKLAQLQGAESEAGLAASAVGQFLLSWVAFAREERGRLEELGDFDASLLDEGERLGARLTRADGGLAQAGAEAARERARWVALRQGFYALAHREVQALRKVADYAYRNHKEARQAFASAGLRRKRRAQQAKREAGAQE